MKICSKCEKELPTEDFYKSHSAKSGYNSCCKICQYKPVKKHRSGNNYPANRKTRVITPADSLCETFKLTMSTASVLIQAIAKKSIKSNITSYEIDVLSKCLQRTQTVLLDQVKLGADLKGKKQTLEALHELTDKVSDLDDKDLGALVSEAQSFLQVIEGDIK